MSYHVEKSKFKELPDKIVVHEDGYYGAWKYHGEPVVDYVYERRDKREVLNGPVHIMFEKDRKMIADLRNLVSDAISVILGWSWKLNEIAGFDSDDYSTYPGKTFAGLYARAEKLGCTKEQEVFDAELFGNVERHAAHDIRDHGGPTRRGAEGVTGGED